MRHRWVLLSLTVSVTVALLTHASAQPYWQAPTTQKPPQDPLDVEELTPGQIKRAQELDQRPAPNTTAPRKTLARPPAAPNTTAPHKVVARPPAAPVRVVACSGAFAKDSSHLKLATFYKPENVDFTALDATEGGKIMASVLFPNDPKRRLEVWWADEAARSDTYLIVINGQSTWAAPKGLKLGLQFPAIEKLNGKPFKVKGFDREGVAQVSDWQGGALEQLPGGCKAGVSLRPDPSTPAEARAALSSEKEFLSNDASIRAVKPAISEILIGY